MTTAEKAQVLNNFRISYGEITLIALHQDISFDEATEKIYDKIMGEKS